MNKAINLGQDVLDFSGNSVKKINLNPEIFDVPMNDVIMYDIIRWHMNKKRQGTHSTKGVSEVSGSTKKSRPQKESGRSRQGDGREPHFRGGGICFGPKPRSYEFSLNKKVRRMAIKISMSKKLRESSMIFVDDFSKYSSHKTADFKNMLSSLLKDNHDKKILFVANDFSDNFCKGANNIFKVNLLKLAGLNSLSILKHDIVVFEEKVISNVEGRLLK